MDKTKKSIQQMQYKRPITQNTSDFETLDQFWKEFNNNLSDPKAIVQSLDYLANTQIQKKNSWIIWLLTERLNDKSFYQSIADQHQYFRAI